MSDQYPLTICSVSYYSQDFLELNWKITSKLNQENQNWQWIIVDNTPEKGKGRPLIENERCIFLEGSKPDLGQPTAVRGSYHHAAGINKALPYINSRFVLFLDPDFYIIESSEWIDKVITYMIDRDLSFFGVPWHPKWRGKYRYFPCVHCLFVDLKKIPLETLDFTPEIHLTNRFHQHRQKNKPSKKLENNTQNFNPDLEEQKEVLLQENSVESQENIQNSYQFLTSEVSPQLWEIAKFLFSPALTLAGRAVGKVKTIIKRTYRIYRRLRQSAKQKVGNFSQFKRRMSLEKRQRTVNISKDTGYKIFQQYVQNNNVKYECIVPVFKLKSDPQVRDYMLCWQNHLIEKLLPDELCYLPKRTESYSKLGFQELDYPDLDNLGWEEFLWQERPFGFHLRWQQQGQLDEVQQQVLLTEILDKCLAKVGEVPTTSCSQAIS